MTSKQRAYLKGLAMKMEPIMQLGKGSVTPRQMAEVLAERTHAQVVQVIGRKIVLYREGKKEKKKIILP